MRKIFYILFSFSLLFASNTKDKTEQSLKDKAELEKKLNKKLDELAQDILQGEAQANITAGQIKSLTAQVRQLEANSKSVNAELKSLTSQNSHLIKRQQQIEDNMLKIISQEFAYDLVVSQNYTESQESIIANEILKELSKNSKNEVNKLAKDYSKTMNLIKTQTDKIEAIKLSIKEYKDKQNALIALQTKQNQELTTLRLDKANYQKQLEKLLKEQKELRNTLEKLAIIEKEKQVKSENSKSANSTNNRQANYQMGAVKKYAGTKTIAPLEKFSIKQNFGSYTDPVYKIKLFNESVVLRSATNDAVVKNVLDGKVVFAKETPLLEKVIIIENESGIHTIYAHLSKIAPTIKVGSRIKKGYVIGRVERDLTFEVTQQNYHINPMELIASN